MFVFSHLPDRGWLGDYQNPQNALLAGRGKYDARTKIFVGRARKASYADFVPDVRMLLGDMKERVSEALGDEYADSFDLLVGTTKLVPAPLPDEPDRMLEISDLPEQLSSLRHALRVAVEEWEAELPPEQQCTGIVVDHVVGYEAHEEVRKADFHT